MREWGIKQMSRNNGKKLTKFDKRQIYQFKCSINYKENKYEKSHRHIHVSMTMKSQGREQILKGIKKKLTHYI